MSRGRLVRYAAGVPELRLRAQKRRPERANLFLDDDYWRAASYDTIALLEIGPGDLTDEQVEQLSLSLDGRDAFDVTMRALTHRARTAGELTDRLRAKQHEQHAIDYALERLRQLSLLDDEMVARQRAEILRDRGRGRRFTEQVIARLGVERELSRSVLDEVYLDVDIDAMIVKTLGRSVNLDEPIDTRTRNRLQARLVRAGHSHEDISRVFGRAPHATDSSSPADTHSAGRDRSAPVDTERIEREVARRFPSAGADYGERRRAMGWCARRGIGHEEFRALMERIAERHSEP